MFLINKNEISYSLLFNFSFVLHIIQYKYFHTTFYYHNIYLFKNIEACFYILNKIYLFK